LVLANPPDITNNVVDIDVVDIDENTTNCSPMDAWWLEAIRVANAIENQQVMEYDHKASHTLICAKNFKDLSTDHERRGQVGRCRK